MNYEIYRHEKEMIMQEAQKKIDALKLQYVEANSKYKIGEIALYNSKQHFKILSFIVSSDNHTINWSYRGVFINKRTGAEYNMRKSQKNKIAFEWALEKIPSKDDTGEGIPCCNDFEIACRNSDANCFRKKKSYSLPLVKRNQSICDDCVYNTK